MTAAGAMTRYHGFSPLSLEVCSPLTSPVGLVVALALSDGVDEGAGVDVVPIALKNDLTVEIKPVKVVVVAEDVGIGSTSSVP